MKCKCLPLGLGLSALVALALVAVPRAWSDDPLNVRTGAIAGVVVTADGRTVPDASVRLINANGEIVARTRSIEGGRFGFRHVRPGHYVVEAARRDVGRGRARVTVEAGHVSRVHVVLNAH